jgi:hypothetical protein
MIYYQNIRTFDKKFTDLRWRSDNIVKTVRFSRSDGWYLRKLYTFLNEDKTMSPRWPTYVKKDNLESFERTRDDII